MANSTIILPFVLCFLSLLNSAYSHDTFIIEGSVYCDTCRVQFFTKLSYFLPGATVQVACKEAVSGAVTVKKEGVTDASGKYRVEVEGDHQDEVCEVSLLKSSDPNCSEVDQSIYVNQTAIVSLTRKDGVVSPLRTVNPLGFFKTQILPQCLSILGELKQHMSNDL